MQYKGMASAPDVMAAKQQQQGPTYVGTVMVRSDAAAGTSGEPKKANGQRGKDKGSRPKAAEMTCKVCGTKGCKGAIRRSNCEHKKQGAKAKSSSSSSSSESSSESEA